MSPNHHPGENLPGAGWGFPVGVDHKGDVSLSEGELSIRDSIRIILGTAKGERVMRPDFGCDIHDHVFGNIDGTMLTLVESGVEEALINWEPRIDVEDVDAGRDPENPNRLLIDITYRVRSTNTESNMVYPFYLTEK
ncbi:GPW/gp25 family protein [Natronobiforma cellulositropha]|uniref:GPW/gp25 family protein n=1 Tax=Natronobiforma cellulositropha TaxID=1679076 RepID=UPI0021D5E3F4|nr:GPW/gp25 family protein [Natronobiforma cellulositropha]